MWTRLPPKSVAVGLIVAAVVAIGVGVALQQNVYAVSLGFDPGMAKLLKGVYINHSNFWEFPCTWAGT
jgi:hypothetical protein